MGLPSSFDITVGTALAASQGCCSTALVVYSRHVARAWFCTHPNRRTNARNVKQARLFFALRGDKSQKSNLLPFGQGIAALHGPSDEVHQFGNLIR